MTFEVYRYNREANNNKPYMQVYQVDVGNCGPMVLDALFKMKEEDPSLTFRRYASPSPPSILSPSNPLVYSYFPCILRFFYRNLS